MDWTPDTVIYHDNCADGFGAAWACWMRWRNACQYVPASYGQAPPYAEVAGKNVLIVDFSYRRSVLEEIGGQAASVVILDHHKTAKPIWRVSLSRHVDLPSSSPRISRA
jgi:hypothetical protein